MADKKEAKVVVHELYNSLNQHSNKDKQLLDCIDVLLQVYLKVDYAHNSDALINRLANYLSINENNFSDDEINLLDSLTNDVKDSELSESDKSDYGNKLLLYNYADHDDGLRKN